MQLLLYNRMVGRIEATVKVISPILNPMIIRLQNFYYHLKSPEGKTNIRLSFEM